MPYICMRRADIPNGILQVLDLSPNSSLRNSIYDPPGQTKYVDRLQNETVAVVATVTPASYKGLAAYLLDNVAAGTTGFALSAANANAMALAIVTNILNAGTAATLATINTQLAGVVGSTALAAGGSIGTVAEVLKVLAGAEYVVPAGTAANAAATFKGVKAGAFVPSKYKATYAGLALSASSGEGALSKMKASTFEYGGTFGAAVVVYDDTGALI